MCVFAHDSLTYKPKQYSETNLENLYHRDHPLIRTSHLGMKARFHHHHYCGLNSWNSFLPSDTPDKGSIYCNPAPDKLKIIILD